MNLPFRIEVDHGFPPNKLSPSGWRTVVQDNSKLYLEGMATAWAEGSPRAPMRLVRDRDGAVLREWPGSDAPSLGMVAGWPTAEQCFRAAKRALGQAPTKDLDDDQRRRLHRLVDELSALCST